MSFSLSIEGGGLGETLPKTSESAKKTLSLEFWEGGRLWQAAEGGGGDGLN